MSLKAKNGEKVLRNVKNHSTLPYKTLEYSYDRKECHFIPAITVVQVIQQ
jgi:hypothetical protein